MADEGGRSAAPPGTSLAESSSDRFSLSLALLYEFEMSDSLCCVFLFVSAHTPEIKPHDIAGSKKKTLRSVQPWTASELSSSSPVVLPPVDSVDAR